MDIASLSLEDLVAKDGCNIPLAQLYQAIDRQILSETERRDINPNQLVRVVHDGKVTWITAKQAEFLLKSESQDEEDRRLKAHVERTLKGEAKILHQELRVFLAIAYGTYKSYRGQGLIRNEEADRIEPALRRRESEISETFSELYDVENRIAATRRRQPLLDDFERRMGLLLNLQQEGKIDQARELARELVEDRKKYMLIARSLEPDINTAYFYRLSSQRIKKKIIGVQRRLCMRKEGVLNLQASELHSQIRDIKQQIDQAQSAQADDPVQAGILRKAQADMSQAHRQMKEVQDELEAVRKEGQVLQKQEQETRQLIDHISTSILKEQEMIVDVQSHQKKMQMKRRMQPTKTPRPKGPDGSRMVTVDRRR